MLDSVVDSPFLLSFVCGLIAAALVSPGYMSPHLSGAAMPAPMPAKFPVRSFARTALIAFVVLINAASLGLAHRFPLGTDLIATGFLMLLFMPPDSAGAGD
jgi:hypothetical protein